jgi:hypothetical protein
VIRLLPLLLLACATDPAPVVDVELRDRLAVVESRLELAEQRMVEQDKSIKQASILAALGGPKRRYTGGVGCDASLYMVGSYGAEACAALQRTGLCDPQPLSVPDKLAVRE